MSRDIKRLIRGDLLPSKLAAQSTAGAAKVIDELLDEQARTGATQTIFDLDLLRKARQRIDDLVQGTLTTGKLVVLTPIGLWGLSEGLHAPDLDIGLLGVGHHRFFLFHSSLGLVVLRFFYRKWRESQIKPESIVKRVQNKIVSTALGSLALGVGIHLGIDVIQPKSIQFPFFGSLIDGTLVDDEIWLLGNSLWAFKIAHDLYAVACSR